MPIRALRSTDKSGKMAEDLIRRLESGEDEKSIKKRPEIGKRTDIPV